MTLVADATPPPPARPCHGRKGCFQWTPERVQALRDLWADGWSASLVAKELGNPSRNSVIGKAHRLGLMGKRTTKTLPQPTRTKRPKNDWDLQQRLMAKAERKTAPEPQRPVRPPPEAYSDRAPLNLTILELNERTCKWPHGDEPPFQFCGHQTFGFATYCPFHDRRARSRGVAA